ncbi:MAG: signal peptidase I [Sphingomonadales bacterium]
MKTRFVLSGFLALALMGTGVHWLRGHVKLAWNETESLPQHLFWVRTDQKPNRGDYVLFEPPKDVNSRYAFIKRVAGIAGDEVAVRDQLVFVAGEKIGIAKSISRKGAPLHTVAPGRIPQGHYFVHTNHRDSYDSRYQSIGLVPDARVIGRATPLF